MLPPSKKGTQVTAAKEPGPSLQSWDDLLVKVFSKAQAKVVHKENPEEPRDQEMLVHKELREPVDS
jgi:hypothetical protein